MTKKRVNYDQKICMQKRENTNLPPFSFKMRSAQISQSYVNKMQSVGVTSYVQRFCPMSECFLVLSVQMAINDSVNQSNDMKCYYNLMGLKNHNNQFRLISRRQEGARVRTFPTPPLIPRGVQKGSPAGIVKHLKGYKIMW